MSRPQQSMGFQLPQLNYKKADVTIVKRIKAK